MIYLDTSVALAEILVEDARPPTSFWREQLIASRLIEYEMWNRIHRARLGNSHGSAVASVLARISIVEMTPPILKRALDPFAESVRTLDALHLATCEHLLSKGVDLQLASFDDRLRRAARCIGLRIAF